MNFKKALIPSVLGVLMSVPVYAQSPMNPWQPPYQDPYMMGYDMAPGVMKPGMRPGPGYPENMQEIHRQRHQAMMERREKMGRDMDCQHDGKGKKDHHGEMKHGKKHGMKHGKKHQEHRQQMEQRLQRIESMLQQLLDQQASSTTAQ